MAKKKKLDYRKPHKKIMSNILKTIILTTRFYFEGDNLYVVATTSAENESLIQVLQNKTNAHRSKPVGLFI